MDDKVALITGASRGIGRACAQVLAERGYKVAIHYRSGEDLAKQLKEKLPGSEIFKADVSVEDDCKALVKDVKSHFGRIDLLVNNAGISIDQVLAFAKPDDFAKILDVNLKSVFMMSKLVAKQMIKQKSGRIVNLSSVIGHTGNGGQSMYAATKGGITAFSKSIAADLAPFGILVNCIAPGFIETEMTDALPAEVKEQSLARIPLKAFGKPEDIGRAVAFLASEDANYITGTTLHVNGGMYTS